MELNIEAAGLAALATILIVGLGFLRNPTRATRLWALAFVIVMLGVFGVIATTTSGIEPLQAACVGALLVGPTLLWSGVRARFGKPSLAWVALIQGVVSTGLLVLLSGGDWYELGLRVVFAVSATFAALTAAELISSPQHGLGMSLPLTMVSVLFPMFALASLVITLRSLIDGSDDIAQSHTSNLLAMVVYNFCAVVTLLHLSAPDRDGRQTGGGRFRRSTLDDRLARAEERQEGSWSLLYISLDDVIDIRLAVGDAAFEIVTDRFTADVRAAFPTEADVVFRSETTAVVLVSRPEATIRANVRSMLNAVATIDPDQPLAVQLAASVGWTTTGTSGYDLDALVREASAAAVDARLAGGDRWVRVGDTPRVFAAHRP